MSAGAALGASLRSGRSLDEGWADALLDQRARFHVALRTTTRLDRWLRVFVGPQPRKHLGRLSAATAASLVADLAVGRWLQEDDRFGLAARLALDTIDTAGWAAVEGSTYDRAVLSGVPLAVEAGARLDAAGLVVPAAGAALTVPLRRRRGWRGRPKTFLWQVAGVGLGAALARHEERHRDQVRARVAERRAARRSHARLEGQSSVAMAADSVVDVLANAGWRLAPETAEVARTLRGWKAELAEQTRTGHEAAYLSTALARWERARNAHPDLSADVHLDHTELAPPVVLTARQVDDLHDALDVLEPRGTVEVRVVEGWRSGGRLPGEALRLDLGDCTLDLAADDALPIDPFDPAVAVGAVGAVWCASTVAANLGGVPARAALPGVAGSLGTVPLLLLARRGQAADLRLALAAHAVVGLVHAGVATRGMTQERRGDGMQPHPWAPGLGALAVTSALAWRDLTPTERAAVVCACAAVVGVGLVATRAPVRWNQLPLALAGPAAAWWAARGLAERLGRETDVLADELEHEADVEVDEAFADGRSSIIAVASAARFEMWRLLEERKAELPPDLVDVVRDDLQVADDVLAAL